MDTKWKSKESLLKLLFVPVVIALLTAGTSPWWVDKLFPPTQPPGNPTEENGSGNGQAGGSPSANPGCPARLAAVGGIRIRTTAQDARVARGDAEIDSDDWTSVKLSYSIRKLNQRRALELVLTWYAQERNKNKSEGDTRIVSTRTFPIYSIGSNCPGAIIESTPGLDLSANREHYYKGKVHTFVPFPDTGALQNIRVRFDGQGRHDDRLQGLHAELRNFSVRLSASKP